MASALFASQVGHLTEPVEVSSAGIRARGEGMPTSVPEPVIEVMATYGLDLRGHECRALTAAMLEESDLVIGMSRRHVQEAILLDPPRWPSAFMLKELVRRGEQVGPRGPEQSVGSWIGEVHGDRTRQSLAHRSTTDEVADPYGGSLAHYRSTAEELAALVTALVGLLWPRGDTRPSG
jgi:protein-tyrosine-phosphatase